MNTDTNSREKDGYSLEQVDVFGVDVTTGEEVLIRHQVRLLYRELLKFQID